MENIVIDGIEYDERMSRSIRYLVEVYKVPADQAAAVLVFFNRMMIKDYVQCASLVIESAKMWGISPVYMLNHGLEAATYIFRNKN